MELDDAVLEEAGSRGGSLLVGKLVQLAEKHHDTEPGVPRSLVEDYIDALDEELVDSEQLRENLHAHLSEDGEATSDGAVYDLGDGRVSSFPAVWHERLDPDDSLAAYVAVMTETSNSSKSAASTGVSKDELLEAVSTLSDRSREDARSELRDLRGDGVLVADADQHPRAGVSLAEDVDFEKDDWDKPDGDRSTE